MAQLSSVGDDQAVKGTCLCLPFPRSGTNVHTQNVACLISFGQCSHWDAECILHSLKR